MGDPVGAALARSFDRLVAGGPPSSGGGHSRQGSMESTGAGTSQEGERASFSSGGTPGSTPLASPADRSRAPSSNRGSADTDGFALDAPAAPAARPAVAPAGMSPQVLQRMEQIAARAMAQQRAREEAEAPPASFYDSSAAGTVIQRKPEPLPAPVEDDRYSTRVMRPAGPSPVAADEQSDLLAAFRASMAAGQSGQAPAVPLAASGGMMAFALGQARRPSGLSSGTSTNTVVPAAGNGQFTDTIVRKPSPSTSPAPQAAATKPPE